MFFRCGQNAVLGSCSSLPIGPVSYVDLHLPCSPELDKTPVGRLSVSVLLFRSVEVLSVLCRHEACPDRPHANVVCLKFMPVVRTDRFNPERELINDIINKIN